MESNVIRIKFGKWDGKGLRMHRHYNKPKVSCAVDNEAELALIQALGDREQRAKAEERQRIRTLRRKYRKEEELRDLYGDDTRYLAGAQS